MAEYKNTLQLLRNLNAPLKLFIAGNHDLSLDSPAVYEKIDEAERVSEETRFDRPMVNQEILAVRDLVKRSKAEGIVFLEEGTHDFVLGNGAALKLFASPYTPGTAWWAFEYSTHDFNIEEGTDVVVTHGPPRGILDISEGGKRMGVPSAVSCGCAVTAQDPLLRTCPSRMGSKTCCLEADPFPNAFTYRGH
ncbi:ser/thr protein phosphatase [Colletotrichum higginsianum]|nr:ser/thr protein phosphatase [Colletotrichum higginsianum]